MDDKMKQEFAKILLFMPQGTKEELNALIDALVNAALASTQQANTEANYWKTRYKLLADKLQPAISEWQDISTAPRDGSTILVYGLPTSKETLRFKQPWVCTAAWDDIDGAFCLSGGDWTGPFIEPTHWMPLPQPPREDKESV